MSTRRLKVIIDKDVSYDIRVGTRLLVNLGVHLREVTTATRAVVITDSNVRPLYLRKARAGLAKAGFEVFDLTIPAGESSKCIEVVSELWDALVMLGIDKGDIVVGLGGGVVCDVAGFVASTYLNGVGYVQAPTSLLAMVDSSIGGTTTINLSGGKNLAGTTKQPVYIAIDLETLATLPENEWANGFAEIAKSALVEGGEFYKWLVNDAETLSAFNESAIQQAIVHTIHFKAKVVTSNEFDTRLYRCLTYGYRFANALGAISNHTISHGCALAEGMRFAARLGVEAMSIPDSFVTAQDDLLNKLGIMLIREAFSADDLYKWLYLDKRLDKNEPPFVFVKQPGAWEAVQVDRDLVKIHLILWEQARM